MDRSTRSTHCRENTLGMEIKMNAQLRKAALWFCITFASAVVAFAAGQTDVPDGPGKAILEGACSKCHNGPSHVREKHYGKDDWEGIVQAMQDRGAGLDDNDFKV